MLEARLGNSVRNLSEVTVLGCPAFNPLPNGTDLAIW